MNGLTATVLWITIACTATSPVQQHAGLKCLVTG